MFYFQIVDILLIPSIKFYRDFKYCRQNLYTVSSNIVRSTGTQSHVIFL